MQKHSDPETIDEYIEQFPIPVRKTLKKIRMTIKKAAPDAGETIKYRSGGLLLRYKPVRNE